jgi:hypothetical protein
MLAYADLYALQDEDIRGGCNIKRISVAHSFLSIPARQVVKYRDILDI